MIEYLILGAGPTGLGAGYELHALGKTSWKILEANSYPGGLAASFKDEQGFTWDIGGHVQFSHYEKFDNAMEEFLGKEGWFNHLRESWVWLKQRFIPYPFQYNIWRLPEEDLSACLEGLKKAAARDGAAPKNFSEWIDTTFGEGIATIFMRPYNFKVWAFQPHLLNTKWVGERVAKPDLERVLKNIANKTDDLAWGPNNTFKFPKKGGTGSIWQSCAKSLPTDSIKFNSAVVDIDIDQKIVTTASGEKFNYINLISTIPLTELIKLTKQIQFDELAKKGLLYSSSNIVGLGLRGQPPEQLKQKCWMYFPESDNPFYRVTVFSNYSPSNVPDIEKNWSLMAEISESIDKPIDQKSIVEETIQGALNTRLIQNRSEVVSTWYKRLSYGYPTPSLHRDEALEKIIPFFDSQGIYSRGRFGLWKYEVSNQDHSFMQGIEIIERLINGQEELTAFDAEYVNSKKHAWPFDRWLEKQ